MYSFPDFPLFCSYISMRTWSNFSLDPHSARYFGVSGKNIRQNPRINEGNEQIII